MAANVVRIANRSLAAALALCAVSALPASAQPVDTFDTNQAALSDPPGGASTVATGGADILGQNRGLSVKRWSGAGPVTAQVAAGALTVSVAGTTPDSRGEAVVTWDGDTNPLMLSPAGLGGVSLTSTGQAFRLTVASATAGVELAFTVYTDAGNASVSGLILSAIASPTDIDVAFGSFVTLAGTGADFASVGAITLAVRGTEKMLVLNGIQVVPSTANVAATLTDNTTSAQPGETLNYSATISNTGPGTASSLNFNDPLDPATTLAPTSVEVSPVAIDDQYMGAIVGTDFSVAAPGVLFNDVDGDGDALVVAPTGARPTAQGGSATVNGDGSFTYTPPVLFQGLDTFTYQADDGNLIPGPGVVTIHVACAAITVSPTTLDPGAVGTPYGPVTFMATGANGAVTWSVVGMLPAGMNFSAAGVLDGTPTAGGSFPLTFVATDAAGCAGSQAITLGINTAPVITSANATTFTVGVAGTFTVTTTGFPTPSIVIGGVALPGTITFVDNGDGTGTLSGTPDPGTGGTYALTFTATNVVGSTPPQSFTLTVNQAPAITSANATTFTVGQAGSFTVTTTGFPAPSIARGGVALPGGVSFVSNGDGTGTLSGTPDPGTGGTYAITFTATNVVGSTPPQSFTLTVNQAPAITSANNATFAPGLAGQTFTVTTTGFPRNPGMTITQTGTLPTGVTFTDNNNGTATVAGTPAAGTQSGSPYLWTLTASNGVPPDAEQNPFTFNVVCPVITVSGTIPALTFNTAMTPVTFTRVGGSGTIAWSATGLPGGLSINASSGEVSGTPNQTGTFDVVVTATDAGACTGTRSITVTVAPVAVADTYNGGVDNTQYVITGGTTGTPGTPSVQNATQVVGNDLPAGGVTATAGTVATGQGGSVTIATDGTYLYTPPLRSGVAAITSDTFSYTVQSNTGGGAAVTSAPATVTINLVGRVWYVLNNGAAGNGQSQSPLQTLASAQTASTANDHIFIYTGSGTTANLNNGIVLKAGQRLIGQGVALMVNGNTLVAAGTNPLIGNSGGAAVTLADGNTISGLTISNPTGFGITGANVNTLTVSAGVIITGAGGGAFSISGGNGAVDFGASITSSANRAVSIVSRTGGSVTLSGAIAASGGTGILLNANGGTSSFTFSGGITLNGASSTFTATSSGTLTITGTNTIGATTVPTSTALNVTSTTIGASGLTFQRISAGTAAGTAGNGIILDTTGSNAGLTITGTGSAASGGTIQHKTGANGSTTQGVGIYLNRTKAASFSRMQLNHFDNFAIRGNEIDGLTLSDVVVSGVNGNSAGDDEGSILLEDAGGTIAISNGNVSGGFEDNLRVLYDNASAGPAAVFNVTGTTFRDLQAAGQNSQVNLRSTTTASSSWNVAFNFTSSCVFENDANTLPPGGTENWSDGILVTFEGPFQHSLNVQNATFHHLFQGLDMASNFSADVNYTLRNNSITFTEGVAAIALGSGSSSTNQSLLTALIQGNNIGTTGVPQSGNRLGLGIVLDMRGEETAQFTLHANVIRRTEVNGIQVICQTAADGNLHLQLTNNIVAEIEDDAGAGAGIVYGMEITTNNPSSHDVCLDARNNDSFNINAHDIRVRQSNALVTYDIEGLTGSGTSAANVEAYLAAQNPGSTTNVRTGGSIVNYTSVANCTTPATQ